MHTYHPPKIRTRIDAVVKKDKPMPSKEQKVSLIMQGYYLSTLELWHGWEERLEHSAYCVSESGDEAVHDEFGEVGCRAGVALFQNRK